MVRERAIRQARRVGRRGCDLGPDPFLDLLVAHGSPWAMREETPGPS